jgi:hypothetical protein
MGTTITPKALLESIKRNAFNGVDLSRVTTMSDEELRTFTLKQEERMLNSQPHCIVAAWLSDQFWTCDKELILMHDPHPWLESEIAIRDMPELLDFSEEDYKLAQWILHVALISHDLYNHARFDLSVLGNGLVSCEGEIADEDFEYSNKPLADWIRDTPYRRVAALVCYQMLDVETNKAIVSNPAVQDFYAMDCWEHNADFSDLHQCEEFIHKALNGMQQVVDHYKKAHSKGLNDEELRVLDAIVGFAPHEIFEEDFPLVRDVCKAADDHMPKPPFIKSEQGQREYCKAVFKDFEQIFAKYEIPFDPSDLRDLTPGYLNSWLYDKYYK